MELNLRRNGQLLETMYERGALPVLGTEASPSREICLDNERPMLSVPLYCVSQQVIRFRGPNRAVNRRVQSIIPTLRTFCRCSSSHLLTTRNRTYHVRSVFRVPTARATRLHRTPWRFTAFIRRSSSSRVHAPLTMSGAILANHRLRQSLFVRFGMCLAMADHLDGFCRFVFSISVSMIGRN